MKSMKKIADELNVTKMTVYNNAKKANVKFQKIDNVNYLSSEDEIIVVNRIKKNKKKIIDAESKTDEKNYDNNDSVKDETIKQLYIQLDIYKKQANRDKEQINTLNRLLENQQVLALESNKKIQKLESQLEEERQLNYSFDTAANARQNINPQEATFTEESQNINQQQKKSQPIEKEINHKDVSEEKKNDSTNEGGFTKEDKFVEETKSDPNDNREVEPPKKGFWSRFFGN
ncbi:putative DNA-binding protein YlxM (UPF0122 family) [Staphylococcus hominis]|uniref:DUF536 domain-containing protein n=1 Tax=Staphylococcus hominis TaxID=1290 RepID=UPI0018ED1503|nr:DUF536 domain-containing protein [Staphylococcus hominis]MBJ6365609.1 DUF536 domain-containing protein [Staphylococcus hominis]MCI2854812.1 DUF536 domain-containing protein [Staphylococcus hominis]MCI2928402.1 DUF536 domain-containing protein [Staphylococcus hominis]MDS3838274.1 DUF536 domain-containing protein [Staphylococcus hominis]MDS3852876.1 DUF536 domain-containing protein [Staphylococcus hominis]